MTKTPIIAADAYHVYDNAYTVIAYLGGGRALYHNGSKDYPFFTEEEATRLARKVELARAIDATHWNDGRFPDMTIRDLEDEYEGRYL